LLCRDSQTLLFGQQPEETEIYVRLGVPKIIRLK
jgi:hypothetical protein